MSDNRVPIATLQRAADRRLKRDLDAQVEAAYARIRAYTPAELEEVRMGVRLSEPEMRRRREAKGWEELGRSWRQVVDGFASAINAFNRGFDNGGGNAG